MLVLQVLFWRGSPLGANETGMWTRNNPVTGDFNIVSPTSPTSAITASTTSPGGFYGTFLVWTVTNTNGCAASDTVIIKNLGSTTPVNAGSDQNLANCNNVSITSAQLNASDGGFSTWWGGSSIALQSGTWSLVNGPNTPVFSNVNVPYATVSNLIAGTYTFRWTVQGVCTSGSDDVTIIVPASYSPSTPPGFWVVFLSAMVVLRQQ